MWEPGSNSRGIILLISVLAFCILIYKAWGPLLFITCALILVVHTCYSLLVNDTLFAPRSLIVIAYAKDIALEFAVTVKLFSAHGCSKISEVIKDLKIKYREWKRKRQLREDMNGRKRNVYRLSTTGTEMMDQTSMLHNDPYHSFALNGAYDIARTSTPIPSGANLRKNLHQNGDIGLFTPTGISPAGKLSKQRSENKQPPLSHPRSEETLYSPKGSPWGNSISPKMRERGSGVKTVQTVAGPLLASTRYNIDPKVYADISSPGLTTRLTKYATEANNKLLHQSQYGTGQFPKINLNASPTPILSPKVARSRMPVLVRIAPVLNVMEAANYSSIDNTSQEKQKTSPNSSASELEKSKSYPSMSKIMEKVPLKRHTSREDSLWEIAKRQRFERSFDGELETLEEIMQKRAREESIASDEDGSPKNERPSKRPKASCHDIINSLSSSMSVYSGNKRKEMDSSRCTTPNIEKHFKTSVSPPSPEVQFTEEIVKSKEQLNVKVPLVNTPKLSKSKEKTPETSKLDGQSPEKTQKYLPNTLNQLTPKIQREIPALSKNPTKLTDKLFMRAEPETNEKYKSIIQEQDNSEAKFTTDDKDEIKKEDIVNMRQNSMRSRLQNMFDAISGKSSKIDPDVVIQAEEVNLSGPSSTFTSLSSLTSTTTVNTSPITTTIVPILKKDANTKSPGPKHVTFDLPSSKSSLSSTETTENKTASFPGSTSAPSFNFGSNLTTTAASTISNFSSPTSSNSVTFASSSPNLKTSTTSAGLSVSSSMFAPKSTAANVATNSTASTTGLSFGNSTTSTSTPSFSLPTSTVKSTGISLSGTVSAPSFGNTLAKSPASTSITQTSTAIPSFGSEKRESSFSFGSASSSSTSNVSTTTSQQSSLFGMPSSTTTSPIFSAASKTVQPTFNATTTTSAATTSAGPVFSFGAANKPTSTFNFGGSSNTSSSTTTFGTSTTTSFGTTNATPTFGAPATATSTGISATYGAPATTSTGSSTFGAPAAASTGSLSFGAPTAASTGSSTFGAPTTASASSGFGATFGTPTNVGSTFTASAASAVNNPSSTASTPAFGTSTPSALFGAPTSTPSLFGEKSAATSGGTSSMFKSPTTTSIAVTTSTSIFGSQSGTPAFGAPSSTTTSTPSLFGNNTPSNSTSAATSMPSLFGKSVTSPAATTATASTIPAFGAQQNNQGSIFSAGNTTQNPTAGVASIFGSNAAATAAPSGLFSGANQAPAASSGDTGGIFGQTKSPSSLSFGSTNATFGSTAPSSSFNAPNISNPSTFGSVPPTSNTLPSFNAVKPTSQFGAPNATSPSTSGSSIFGSSTTSGFGQTSPTPAFGSTNAFGSTSNTPAASFGSTAPPAFGSTGATTSPFGAQPTTTTPTLFGNTAAPGTSTVAASSAGNTFSFGSAQQTQSQPQAQANQGFNFGSAASPPAPAAGGVFQFGGAAAAPKPAGFNFNAPTAGPTINFTGGSGAPGFNAPPAFNAPPGGAMFSIGSGSSTPRSRTNRQRRQR